jgi:hypothetical protein
LYQRTFSLAARQSEVYDKWFMKPVPPKNSLVVTPHDESLRPWLSVPDSIPQTV